MRRNLFVPLTALILAAMMIWPHRAFAEGYFPHPGYPVAAVQNHDQGIVIVRVRFGKDGKVTRCTVVDSNASQLLQDSTVRFITARWFSLAEAGKETTTPINYSLDGADLRTNVSPPNFLRKGDPDSLLRLRVEFDANGAVSKVDIVKSTGIPSVDQKTGEWIKQHWRTKDLKGSSVQVPLFFEHLGATST